MIKRRNAAGSSRIPSRLAHRARPIRQYRDVATLSRLAPPRPPPPPHPAVPGRRDFVEAAPPPPADPRLRLPPASPRRCDGREIEVFHLHSDRQRLDRKSTRLNSSHANISYA